MGRGPLKEGAVGKDGWWAGEVWELKEKTRIEVPEAGCCKAGM